MYLGLFRVTLDSNLEEKGRTSYFAKVSRLLQVVISNYVATKRRAGSLVSAVL